MLLWGAFQKKFGQTWAFGSTGLTLGHFRKNWKTGSCPGEQLFYWVFGGKVAFFSFLLVGIGTSILLGKTKVYIHYHHLTCRDPQDASSCFSFQDDFVQCSYLSLCLFLEVVKAINHVSGEASILWGIWAGFLVGGIWAGFILGGIWAGFLVGGKPSCYRQSLLLLQHHLIRRGERECGGGKFCSASSSTLLQNDHHHHHEEGEGQDEGDQAQQECRGHLVLVFFLQSSPTLSCLVTPSHLVVLFPPNSVEVNSSMSLLLSEADVRWCQIEGTFRDFRDVRPTHFSSNWLQAV